MSGSVWMFSDQIDDEDILSCSLCTVEIAIPCHYSFTSVF